MGELFRYLLLCLVVTLAWLGIGCLIEYVWEKRSKK